MNETLAIEYIKMRMRQMGYENNFYVRVKHLVLDPMGERIIDAHNHFIVLISPNSGLRVESDTGMFDSSEMNTNEWNYEHQGEITIQNQNATQNNLQYLQAIPNPVKPCQ
jgi:hypothetical protein